MNDISTEVKNKLKESNLAQIRAISAGSGVPYRTLLRLKYEDVNPRIDTLQPIFNYLKQQEAVQ
jgi:predicted transcriptional regulator